ncbi:MAG: hypothetical protein WBD74_02860 [Candidatus Aquilonibacter sp.]
MTSSPARIGSILLPALALLWLGMTYASGFGHQYIPDYHLDRIGLDRAVVVSAAPAVAAAGVSPGAHIDFAALPFADRLRASGFASKNMIVRVPIVTPARTHFVSVPATRNVREVSAPELVRDMAAATFSLLLLAYLGFRRPSTMVAILITAVGGGALSFGHFAALISSWPDALFTPVTFVLRTLCDDFPVLVLSSFAIRMSRGSASRPALVRSVDGIVAAGFITESLITGTPLIIPYAAFCAAVLLVSSIIALLLADPQERGRVGIVFVAIMIGGVGYALATIGLLEGWINFNAFSLYANLSIVIIPLALAYAILRHRIFDVAFVLNRTIVYAVTSALLLLLFAALEFAAERYLNSLSHFAGLALEFAIALAVIVSARLVHARVDRAVDAILFRSRHEQESALRRYATTVQFYTAKEPLVRDTVDTLVRCGRVSGAAVYLAENDELARAASLLPSAVQSIDANDPVYVELRAHHERLDLHAAKTTVPGVRVYPMILAGRLVGIAAVGERESFEQMPPDIDEAIARVCDAVAIAIAAIETDSIREENVALRKRLDTFAPAPAK